MKVKLDDIITALEFINGGLDCNAYYNPETKEIEYVDSYMGIEDEDEDKYDACIGLPTKYEINEYEMMEDFIETIEDAKLYNQLQFAINGRGAFRMFKNTCFNFGIIDDWYKFRDEKYKEIAREWCNENKINFE